MVSKTDTNTHWKESATLNDNSKFKAIQQFHIDFPNILHCCTLEDDIIICMFEAIVHFHIIFANIPQVHNYSTFSNHYTLAIITHVI